MASQWPCSPPSNRGRPAPAASSCGALPLDALSEILLRLPAKDLCRLRAVCRSWYSVTSDPFFIGAHAARHPGPLFLAKFRGDRAHIHVVDLSGTVIKRMPETSASHQVLFTRLNLACLATEWNRCRVLNPATGAVRVLPEGPAPNHVNRVNLSNPYTFFALGRVTSTAVYKVFRMFNRPGFMSMGQQLFELFTINGCTDHARWREMQSPVHVVKPWTGVVADGVVYFFVMDTIGNVIPPDFIVSFDLGREEWRRGLTGPISGNAGALEQYRKKKAELDLAELKGYLVVAHYHESPCRMDLWFLTNFENEIWVKEYSIPIIQTPNYDFCVKPLFVLDDGRLVLYQTPIGQLLICDPGANTFAEVEMGHLDSVGVFTGSLLGLPEGDVV
ncbi:hypothetical protein PR202_gb12610 [Eleusine coracana subsp. coracana]|uniref:F-box domain-containing protein n=1 Tax=Eleusine coracana subsp. coracana TaxID=191504 RepID=A0AAV5EPT8_ELECO|nr:hypothetical protein PR202_gb12610 [Eleusine coracana subsp. coracana]